MVVFLTPFRSFSVRYLKIGAMSPPLTETFAAIGNVTPKFFSQKEPISSLLPGSCPPKLFAGKPITTRLFVYSFDNSSKSAYCGVKPHSDAVLTTKIFLPLKKLISVFDDDQGEHISLASLKIKLSEIEEIKNPNNVKVITDNQGFALYFSRSLIPYPRETSVKAEYFKHIGVYAFRKSALLNFAKLKMQPLEIAEKIECIRYLEYGMKIKMIETDFIGVGIDVPEDLEKARNILKNDQTS